MLLERGIFYFYFWPRAVRLKLGKKAYMKLDTVILEMNCMHILEMIFMHLEKGQSSVL